MALSATLMFRGLGCWLPMLPGLWCSRRVTTGSQSSQAPAELDAYWVPDAHVIAGRLGSGRDGLSQAEAERRLRTGGPNRLRARRSLSRLAVVWAQIRNPLLLILVFAAVASAFSGEWIDAAIVLVIVVASVGIGYSREYSAQAAVAALQAQVRVRTTVVRDGRTVSVPLEEVVPGDVVMLSAGSLIPGDGVILEATDCYVSEAVLTGESFPTENRPGTAARTASLRDRTNCLFLGTNVRSGTARCLIVATGRSTEFGAVAARLSLRPPETEFDRGIRRFGYLMTIAMLLLVFLVFVAHVLRGRPPVETLLFSVALAVGLSPELLPAILAVSLARGAQMMARHGVIVRRLNAIENLGSMNILCTDKTGTLTEGVVQLEGSYDPFGVRSSEVLSLGACNAALETGLNNPLDDAILEACRPDFSAVRKVGEIPFDFVRKRVSVMVDDGQRRRLIVKGAFTQVLEACTRASDGQPLGVDARAMLTARYDAWTSQGIRVLAVAVRTFEKAAMPDRDDEVDLTFAGFLTFLDRPKPGASDTIAALARLGVAVKLITGDSKLVAQHVAALVGLRADHVVTGAEMLALNDEALWHVAEHTDLFVEVDPNQKERVILALKKMGHVVGFLGDGVNDAPAMHAADTSLSVDDAVDVAREAADFVLLQRDLDVIRQGIEEGRKTFANTLKYILTTTSANLGNMLSMAAASVFLPFLPMLAGQILLNNFLSDIPTIGIADDSVDPELVRRPERWSMRFIGRFMLTFGVLSSAFDGLLFVALLFVFRVSPTLFRTTWFVESLLTELAIALVVRTRRPFYRSRPGRVLLLSTLCLVPLALALPYLPGMALLDFVPLPASIVAMTVGVTAAYIVATEAVKRRFYRMTERACGGQPGTLTRRP
jgi:Mg2+-importing ATPase